MRERPILFSAPMIGAILSGSKSQTRRTVRTVPSCHDADRAVPALLVKRGEHAGSCVVLDDKLGPAWSPAGGDPYRPYQWHDRLSPFGEPGDRLWVRETWRPMSWSLHGTPARGETEIEYRADVGDRDDDTERAPWRPSIFLPRWASRITLEVTGVRVERLQAVTEADAKAEGVRPNHLGFHREMFCTLWDAINAKRAPWASNPWIWVVSFARHGCT